MASLEHKLTRVEINIGEILEWKDTNKQFIGDINDTSDGKKESISFTKEEFIELINTLQNEFHEKVTMLEAKVNLCKAAIVGGSIAKTLSYTEAPKPMKYGAKQTLKNLTNYFGRWNVTLNLVK